jgi:DNA-binding NtrC family response regulator
LFGHVRGSFTGAFRNHCGWLERAEDGTFFLDEAAEMSLRMQASLLRFVENGEIQRVGSNQVKRVGNVRIVAATNRDLSAHVAKGRFREDLFYRLNVIHMVVPPLRERLEDVPPLARHFLDRFAAAYQLASPTLSEGALTELTRHPWPGNVRELSNVMERLVVRSRGRVIAGDDVLTVGLAQHSRISSAPSQRGASDDLYERMVKAGESFWSAVHGPFTCHDLTRADLRALLARGLEQTKGDYRSLLTLFNAPEQDYKRFLTFLAKHGCPVPGRRTRSVPMSSTPSGCQ